MNFKYFKIKKAVTFDKTEKDQKIIKKISNTAKAVNETV